MKDAASAEPMPLQQDQRISEVVKREQSRLRNFIRRRVPDPRDAEDILQDVFYMDVLEQPPHQDPSAVILRVAPASIQ